MEPGDQLGQLGRQPRPREGAAAPLFERLLEGEPDGPGSSPPGRLARLERPAVAASVGRELSRLFNTRLLPGTLSAGAQQGTVAAFGVPDWSAVNPASSAELAALAQTLAVQARAFEPRLEAICVELEPDPIYRRRARGRMAGLLRLERALEPVTFSLALDHAEIAVGDPETPASKAEERTTCPQESKTSAITSTN